MLQTELELEKKEVLQYLNDKINKINGFLAPSITEDMMDESQFKASVLDIVEKLNIIKEQEVSFYNSLLLEIPILNLFEDEINDLDAFKKYLANIVRSTQQSINVKNLNNLISSSEIFEFINKKTDIKNLEEKAYKYGGDVFLFEYIGSVWKQAKQEELLGLIIYINSGKATIDYINYLAMDEKPKKETFLYEKFQESFHDFVVKETAAGEFLIEERKKSKTKKVSAANHLDYGVIIDAKKKIIHLGFATSEYCTKSQQKQFFQKHKILKEHLIKNKKYEGFQFETYYITAGLINENQKEYNKEYQKNFLNSFKKELSLTDKNILNCASIVALMGNLASTDKLNNMHITDFLSVHPYISGSDNKNIKETFDSLKKSNNPKEFRDFLIDYSTQILNIFEKLKIQEKMTDIHAKVLINCESIFKASLENFYLTFENEKDLLEKKYIQKVFKFNKLYEKIHLEKFQGSMPNSSDLAATKIYDIFSVEQNIEDYLLKNTYRLKKLSMSKPNIKLDQFNVSKNTKEKIRNLKPIIEDLPVLAINNNRILTVIEEMCYLRKNFPNREIKTLMRSNHATLHTHNFMKIYRKWEAQENKNIKYHIANIIFDNIDNLDNMHKELKDILDNLKSSSETHIQKKKNRI